MFSCLSTSDHRTWLGWTWLLKIWSSFKECLVQKLVSWCTKLMYSLITLLLFWPGLFNFSCFSANEEKQTWSLILCYWSHFEPQITCCAWSFSCLLWGIQQVQSEFLISHYCSALFLVITLPVPVFASFIRFYLFLAEITQLGEQSCSITSCFDSWPIWLLTDSLFSILHHYR